MRRVCIRFACDTGAMLVEAANPVSDRHRVFLMAKWWNQQTRDTQNVVPVWAWECKSPLGYFESLSRSAKLQHKVAAAPGKVRLPPVLLATAARRAVARKQVRLPSVRGKRAERGSRVRSKGKGGSSLAI